MTLNKVLCTFIFRVAIKNNKIMSVDYSANFGIGQEIKTPTDEEVNNSDSTCEDWFDYLNKITKNTDFRYIQHGSAYDDEEMKMCIVFDSKFNNTLDLNLLKTKFDIFIKTTILRTIGDFGVVGGLEES